MVFGINGRSSSSSSIVSPGSNRDATDGSNRKKKGRTMESNTTNVNGNVKSAEEVPVMNGINSIGNLNSGEVPNEDSKAAVGFTENHVNRNVLNLAKEGKVRS